MKIYLKKVYNFLQKHSLPLFIILLGLSLFHYFSIGKGISNGNVLGTITSCPGLTVLKNLNWPAAIIMCLILFFFCYWLPKAVRSKGDGPSGYRIANACYIFGIFTILFIVLNRWLNFYFYNKLNEWDSWIIWEKVLYVGITTLIFFNAFFLGFYLLVQIVLKRNRNTLAEYGAFEIIFISIVLGLGILGQGAMIIGYFYLFDFWFFAFLHSVIGIIGLLWLKRYYKEYMPPRLMCHAESQTVSRTFKFFEYGVWFLLVFFLAICLLDRFNYIGGSDAQSAHLLWVRKWLDAGCYYPIVSEMTGSPIGANNTQPLMGRLLYLHGAILGNFYVTGIMQLVFCSLVFSGIYLLAYRIFGRVVALGSLLIYMGNFFLWKLHIFEVDDYILNALITLGCAYLIFLFYKTRNNKWLPMVGVAIGFLLCVKYHAIIESAFLIGITAVIIIYRARKNHSNLLNPMLTIFIPPIIIAAPWFIENWMVFGNPIYPFARDLFGGVDMGHCNRTFSYVTKYGKCAGLIKSSDTILLLPRLRMFLINLIAHYSMSGYPRWFTFSPIYLPALFCGIFRRNRFVWIALFYFALFYTVATFTLGLAKFMILILTLVTPVVSFIIFSQSSKRWYRGILFAIITALVFHSAFFKMHLKPEKKWFMPEPKELPLFADLKSDAFVLGIGNIVDKWLFINIPVHLADCNLYAEDWQKAYCYWKAKGATHYLILPKDQRDRREKNPWPRFIPYMEQFKDPNVRHIKKAADIWERNITQRDAYLSQFSDINKKGELILIELPPGLPEFCKDAGKEGSQTSSDQ